MEIRGIVYNITCVKTDKKYIGQTLTHKKTRGKYYSYGIRERLVEHIGAAKRGRNTPLCKAICEHGNENFKIEEIKRCELEMINTLESLYITQYNTLVPNGYNVQEHSRPRSSKIYVDNSIIENIEIRGIKENDENKKVRVLVKYKNNNDRTRYMFGSGNETFEDALNRAKDFCSNLADKDKIIEHNSLNPSDKEWWPYKEKIDKFDTKQVSRLRLTLFNNSLVRVHIKTNDMKSWKEEVKYTFGGKKIPLVSAFLIAESFAQELSNRHNLNYTIEKRLYQCSQQAAASEVEEIPQEINSVNSS